MPEQPIISRRAMQGVKNPNIQVPSTNNSINSVYNMDNVLPTMVRRHGTEIFSENPNNIKETQHISITTLDTSFILELQAGQYDIIRKISIKILDLPTIRTSINGTSVLIIDKDNIYLWELADNTLSNLLSEDAIEKGLSPPYYSVFSVAYLTKSTSIGATTSKEMYVARALAKVEAYDRKKISFVSDEAGEYFLLNVSLNVASKLKEKTIITLMDQATPFATFIVEERIIDTDKAYILIKCIDYPNLFVNKQSFKEIRIHSSPEEIISSQGRFLALVKGNLCFSQVGNEGNFLEDLVIKIQEHNGISYKNNELPETIPSTSAFSQIFKNFVNKNTKMSILENGILLQTLHRCYLINTKQAWSYSSGISSVEIPLRVFKSIIIGQESFIVQPSRTRISVVNWRVGGDHPFLQDMGRDFNHLFSSKIKDIQLFGDTEIFVLLDDGKCVLINLSSSGANAFPLSFGQEVKNIISINGDIHMNVIRNDIEKIEVFPFSDNGNTLDLEENQYSAMIEWRDLNKDINSSPITGRNISYQVYADMGEMEFECLSSDGKSVKEKKILGKSKILSTFPNVKSDSGHARILWDTPGSFNSIVIWITR